VEPGLPPKGTSTLAILAIVLALGAVASGLLYYFLVYSKGG
jgi:hypothetical protein